MARSVWFVDNETGKLLTAEEHRQKNAPPDRSFCVIDDSMPPTEHLIDGKIYESKSAFRAVTKAHGCVEVGNDSIRSRWTEPSIPDPIPMLKQVFKDFRE